jgi:tartrate dehydratase alpha subunit/fumarate hydratase class I-like protein
VDLIGNVGNSRAGLQGTQLLQNLGIGFGQITAIVVSIQLGGSIIVAVAVVMIVHCMAVMDRKL